MNKFIVGLILFTSISCFASEMIAYKINCGLGDGFQVININLPNRIVSLDEFYFDKMPVALITRAFYAGNDDQGYGCALELQGETSILYDEDVEYRFGGLSQIIYKQNYIAQSDISSIENGGDLHNKCLPIVKEKLKITGKKELLSISAMNSIGNQIQIKVNGFLKPISIQEINGGEVIKNCIIINE